MSTPKKWKTQKHEHKFVHVSEMLMFLREILKYFENLILMLMIIININQIGGYYSFDKKLF